MNEALILEKLDSLSSEIQSLKSEVQALKAPTTSAHPAASGPLAELTEQTDRDNLTQLVETLSVNAGEISDLLFKIKAGNDLARDVEPIAKQVYPHVIQFFDELDGQLQVDELTNLLRNFLTNLGRLNEGIQLLRMGLELKDELIPIAQVGYPKVIEFFNVMDEAGVKSEQIGDLVQTLLMNVTTFTDLLGMLKPANELIKDVMSLLRTSDLLDDTNTWLDNLQQYNGVFKVAGTALTSLQQIQIDDQQAEEMCRAIQEIDLTKIKPVTPFGAIKHLRDPQVQEALGAVFMVLQTMGACLQACQQKSSVS